MAGRGNHTDGEKLCCSICLDVLKEPTTIPCGHNYCLGCIRRCWDEEQSRGTSSCPQCRQSFTPRPSLAENRLLAQLVEELKQSGVHAAPEAGPEDVACDFCSARKLKAVRSCLTCLASYCEQHLQAHHQAAPFRKHRLAEPSRQLQENLCSLHDEPVRAFCRTDRQCICFLCSLDQHKGHDVVCAAAERAERQRELELCSGNIQQTIREREEDLKLLQQELEATNRSADTAVTSAEKIFSLLILHIQNKSSDLKQQIRNQQEYEVSRVRRLQTRLEQEITELKKRDAELKQLSVTEDHVQFLRKFSPPPQSSPGKRSHDSCRLNLHRLLDYLHIEKASSESVNILTEIFSQHSLKVTLTQAKAEKKTRAEFLRHSQKIYLDPKTAHQNLTVESNTWVGYLTDGKPEKTEDCVQILSDCRMTGRCYWEVEVGGRVSVALLYNSPVTSGFGGDEQSWSLEACGFLYLFRHDGALTVISGPPPSTVGVYLDHSAGALCFYHVSKSMTLLHRVETCFSQPLYAGLGLHRGTWAEMQ
uniref:Tripartite motif-containing protein 16-like n=1 Tax=Salarias fasciatus TaxID=181472 RepID=A0A672HL13_SALFA